MLRNFGTAANQVLWRGQVALLGDPSFANDAVFAVDKWLGRVRCRPPGLFRSPQKIIEDKPNDVADSVYQRSGPGVALHGYAT